MQWNEELFKRGTDISNVYSYGKKIDFILKDSQDNELNTNEFKKKNVSIAVLMNQQVKNLRDNAAIMVESIKLIEDGDIAINGIDYVGNSGYAYEMVEFKDVLVALPVSRMNTPENIEMLKEFESTLNCVYYVKVRECYWRDWNMHLTCIIFYRTN
jgi:hypothetical protein